ncbi:unnamed protein product [Brachionus calyciflorus]|uniref:Amidase domain-containing protein n=1 Tax=Brachionus calyciflorus TaxID=104777 RepID=A0A813S132_9BILA|nr:unnamed protein product [Brachionus calyciflorus]
MNKHLINFLNLFKPLFSLGFRVSNRNTDVRNPLPKCKNDLLLTPAHKLAKKIRNKEVSCEELVSLFIDRIKEIQPLVNCVVQDRFDEALKEAKEFDRILALDEIPDEYNEQNCPFLGVPFSCKESLWVKGMMNTCGLVNRKEFRAPEDAVVVQYMKKAGGILTCITNTSECCLWIESTNYVTGTTRNPYNLSRIVGGSSGGEACIVSSCGAVWGIGSDIGGSIRIPSFFNGVYGHKPTRNTISIDFQYPNFSGIQLDLLSNGPICRYASDLKFMFKIFCGRDYKNFEQNFERVLDLKKLKFFYIKDLQGNFLVNLPSEDLKNSQNKAIKFLEGNLGVQVNELKLKNLHLCFDMWSSMMNNGTEDAKWLASGLNDETISPFKELFRSLFGLQDKHTLPTLIQLASGLTKSKDPLKSLELAEELRQEIKDVIGDDGIILFPSFPTVAPYHNSTAIIHSFDFLYFAVLNMLGFPVTQIPLGLSEDGLPTGIQLVANHNMDHLTIRLAEYFESNLVGWIPPF